MGAAIAVNTSSEMTLFRSTTIRQNFNHERAMRLTLYAEPRLAQTTLT